MKAGHAMDRRNFLRGTGIALAIPFLESQGNQAALAANKSDSNPRRLVCIGNHLGFWPDGFFPTTAGEDYEMSVTLQGIEKHRRDFTVFSNLDHGISGGHSAVHNFLSGVKKTEASGFDDKNMTLDQAAAEFAGSAARYPSIVAGIGEGTNLCWTRSGVRIPPVNNPGKLFQACLSIRMLRHWKPNECVCCIARACSMLCANPPTRWAAH